MKENKQTILIVDDESSIRSMIKIFLEASGFETQECAEGKEAFCALPVIKPDLILLDLGLPDIDGKDAVTFIRSWTQAPIIIISSRDDDLEIAAALDAGADDYIVKPFNLTVLLARINANLRTRYNVETAETNVVNGPILIDMLRHEVFIHDNKISLTPKEFGLLHFFVTHRGKMLTHRQILKAVWGSDCIDNFQYLRVYIGHLRNKAAACNFSDDIIINEPGIGYRMKIFDNEKVFSESGVITALPGKGVK